MNNEPKEPETLGQPLTPNSIPVQKFSRDTRHTKIRKLNNPMDFRPTSGFFQLIKLPGLIFFGMIVAYLIGRWGFNFVFLVPVAHIVYFVFRRRVHSYTRTLDVLSQEKQRKEAVGEYETVEWLNYIIKKFWEVSEARVSSEIYSAVNKELKANTPKVLKSLKLTELTLGTRPPVVEKIGFINRNEDIITVEFAVNFIPMETSADILSYFGEEKSHWNTCIELTATVGFISLPILVRNFTFSGIFRAKIELVHEIPFIKSLSICMLDLPLVDFELHPLKVVDFMDMPYISKAISSIINTQVRNHLLFPQSLFIDLQNIAEYKGKTIGVVYVRVGQLETSDDTAHTISLTMDGREFFRTAQRTGTFPAFNEGAYVIVKDSTQHIGITAHSESENAHGKIFLRNLNKYQYTETVHLAAENKRKWLDVSTRFFRMCEKKTDSGIVVISLVSITDLQALGDPKNRVYSTYCRVSVETKESIRLSTVLKTFETRRIFSTKDAYYNETFKLFVRGFDNYMVRISVMDEKTDKQLGSLLLPMSTATDPTTSRYRLSGVTAGDATVRFDVDYVNMTDGEDITEAEEVSEVSCEEESIDTDSTDISISALSDLPEEASASVCNEPGTPKSQGPAGDIAKGAELGPLASSESSAAEAVFYFEESTPALQPVNAVPGAFNSLEIKRSGKYLNDMKPSNKMPNPVEDMMLGIYNTRGIHKQPIIFNTARKFEIESITDEGMFYLVFETKYVNCKMEPFSTDLKIKRSVIVPIKDERFIRVRLFRMLMSGDILVSEERMLVTDTVIVFDTVRITLSSYEKPMTSYAAPDTSEHYKIIQFTLTGFTRPSDYTLDVQSGDLTIYSKLPFMNTFIATESEVQCTLTNNERQKFQFALPLRTCEEQLNLGSGLSCLLRMSAQTASGLKQCTPLKSGVLEIYIIKAHRVPRTATGAPNPYIKVYLNNEKIYKTARKSDATDPIFNESLKINVHKNIDMLGFYMCEYSAITATSILAFKEVSLLNLNEGYSKFDMRMDREDSSVYSDTVLQVIFNYTPGTESNGSYIYRTWNN